MRKTTTSKTTKAKSATKGAPKAAAKQAGKPAAKPAAKSTTPKPAMKVPSRTALKAPARVPANPADEAPTKSSRHFSFVDADRTFTCAVEPLRRAGTDAWWWFHVSTEQHQRHAPFRAEPDDTLESVQKRIVTYYDELLARRAAPAPSRWNRRPAAPAGDAAGGATGAAIVDPAAEDDPGIDEAIIEEIAGEVAALEGADEAGADEADTEKAEA